MTDFINAFIKVLSATVLLFVFMVLFSFMMLGGVSWYYDGVRHIVQLEWRQ